MDRVAQRQIAFTDLQRLQQWVRTQPYAPEGDWYKDFGSFKLCGDGEYPKTFLTRGMKPDGVKID
jgi:hypothetical protein